MTSIIDETQLDFQDVLIKAKRSTIASRKDADIQREYKFKVGTSSDESIFVKGTGIFNANMGTTGTFAVAKEMLKQGLFATLHKHYTLEELIKFFNNDLVELATINTLEEHISYQDLVRRCFISIGLRQTDFDKLLALSKEFIDLDLSICIDVPNAYIPQVKDLVIKCRQEFPESIIMVGNVITGDITEDLILNGANIIKCGIGPGSCLPAGTLIQCFGKKTNEDEIDYYKPIEEITEEDLVYCYNEQTQQIALKRAKLIDQGIKKVIKLTLSNGESFECTSDHEIYSNGQWKKAEDMLSLPVTTDHNAIYHDWENKIIVNAISSSEEKQVYDLEIDDNDIHNFFIYLENNEVLVHNCCLTRKMTGVGRPQLSTIIECADAAHQVGGMICADGGITCPGDVCKAFAAGADFVMLGGFYAGTDEADGDIIERCYKTTEYELDNDKPDNPIFKHKKYKIFYGMSSEYAQDKHYSGMPKYRASEGRVVEVPYTGSMEERNNEILGGLRSCMTYVGASKLKDLPKCATFYKVNHQLNTIFEGNEI